MSVVRPTGEVDVRPAPAGEPRREQRVLWLFGDAPPATLREELEAQHCDVCDRDASVWPVRRISALLELKGSGDAQTLKGRRLAVVQRDPGAADALAEALRARGATVVVLSLDDTGLSRVEALDPEVVVVHPAEHYVANRQVVDAIWNHTWLRWTPVLLVGKGCLGPVAEYAPDVRELAQTIHHLSADFELLLRRARRNEAFTWRLDQLGPVRTLRALLDSEHSMRVQFVTAKGSFEVDLGEGLLIGARAALNGAGGGELAGVHALATLFEQESGSIQARPVSYPAYTNVMAPLETVLLSERPVPQWSAAAPIQERKSVTQVRAVVLATPDEREQHSGSDATGPRKVLRGDKPSQPEPSAEKPAPAVATPARDEAPTDARARTVRAAPAPAPTALKGGTLVGLPVPQIPGAPPLPPRAIRARSLPPAAPAAAAPPTPIVSPARAEPAPALVEVLAPAPGSSPEAEPAVTVCEEPLPEALDDLAFPDFAQALRKSSLGAGLTEQLAPARALLTAQAARAHAGAAKLWSSQRLRLGVLTVGGLLTGAALLGVLSQAPRALPAPSAQLSAAPSRPATQRENAKASSAKAPGDTSAVVAASPLARSAARSDADKALTEPAPGGDPERNEKQASELVGDGHSLRRHGKLDEARAAYQEALALYPGYPRALAGIAEVHLATKDATRAIELAKVLVRRRPKFADDQRLLGDAYMLAGKKSEAVAAYKHASRLGSRTARQRLKDAR